MNRTNGYIGIVVLFVILILGIGIYIIQGNYQAMPPEVVEQIPTPKPVPDENQRIIAAVELFASSAPAIFEKEFVCKGGFINEEIDGFKRISDTIVRNRIFDPQTKQYAVNQDEAGISCHEYADGWVLATVLNGTSVGTHPGSYCVDSTGNRGAYWADKDTFLCVPIEI